MRLSPAQNLVLTIKQLYGILIPFACIIMKIDAGFPILLHIEIQPVIVRNLKISLTSISKGEFLSFALARNRISLSTKSNTDKSGTDVENQGSKKAQTHGPKPKIKKASSRNTSFNNPLAETLIKNRLK